MGLVHAVLYCAFAVVALWLLGELLLQRRAPVHWRALAFGGFLVLVAGVAKGSMPLIGAGVAGFGAGQWLTTQAVKRGSGEHWALRAAERLPLVARLFGAEAAPPPEPEPEPLVGEVGPVEEHLPEQQPVPEQQPETAWAPVQEQLADAWSAQDVHDAPDAQQQYAYGYQQGQEEYEQDQYGGAHDYQAYAGQAYEQPSYEQQSYQQQSYEQHSYEQQGVYVAAESAEPQLAYYWDGQQYVAYYPEYQPQPQVQGSGWADQSGGY